MESINDLLNFGFVVIDKPEGPTSHQVSSWVKEILNVKKAGHAGTLDPNVSGVLPVALNRATKIINLLHLLEKEYVALLYLHGKADEKRIRNVFKEFVGDVYQTVPVRAAVSRKTRIRKIFSLEIIEIEERNVLFTVSTESGTYIRTLCVDLGDAIGTGGNLLELRRIRTGHLDENSAHTLQELKDAYEFYKEGNESYLRKILRSGEDLVSFLPRVIVKETSLGALAHGAPLYSGGIEKMEGNVEKNKYVSVYSESKIFVGVAKLMEKISEKDPFAKMEHVFIDWRKYPARWKK